MESLPLPPIFALYRYFLAAEAMRRYFHQNLREKQYWRALEAHPGIGYLVLFHLGPPGVGMAYFYSAMYVLIEGWGKLGYRDSKIDALLDSPFVDLLRRFRNATFHFQHDLVSEKWSEFVSKGEGSSQWIQQLRNAFSEFFLRESTWTGITPPMPEKLRAQVKGKPVDEVIDMVTRWFQANTRPSE